MYGLQGVQGVHGMCNGSSTCGSYTGRLCWHQHSLHDRGSRGWGCATPKVIREIDVATPANGSPEVLAAFQMDRKGQPFAGDELLPSQLLVVS